MRPSSVERPESASKKPRIMGFGVSTSGCSTTLHTVSVT